MYDLAISLFVPLLVFPNDRQVADYRDKPLLMHCAACERPLEMPMTTFCCICNKRLSWAFYVALGFIPAAGDRD